jgi:hypothetical protein
MLRAMAAALGVTPMTVSRDQKSGETNVTPDDKPVPTSSDLKSTETNVSVEGNALPTNGIDGKTRIYQRKAAPKPSSAKAKLHIITFRHGFQCVLAARKGKQKTPNGYLAALIESTGKSRAELGYRAQFASLYPTDSELANALANCSSWHDVVVNLSTAPKKPFFRRVVPVTGRPRHLRQPG